MEQRSFDALARRLGSGATRRAALGLAAALGVGGLMVGAGDVDAKKKKKQTFCLNGDEVKAKNKKKKKRLRKEGATKGKCDSTCTPVCPTTGECGGSDGCGGICGCSGNAICVAGTCTACTVTCTGTAATCGAALQAALGTPGEVYVCPGLYGTGAPGFSAVSGVSIYGAGSGSDQARNTILDAGSAAGAIVLTMAPGTPATLFGLRITGGNSTISSGGISSAGGGKLTIDSCAVVGNTGTIAGGISVIGPVELVNSTITGNTGTAVVGGVYIDPLMVGGVGAVKNSVIDGNAGDSFGGLYVNALVLATITVDSATKITNNTIAATIGDRAGGVGLSAASPATVNVTGVTISGNTTPQCFNVTGCSS